jgi:hypothetical protein
VKIQFLLGNVDGAIGVASFLRAIIFGWLCQRFFFFIFLFLSFFNFLKTKKQKRVLVVAWELWYDVYGGVARWVMP